MARSHKDRLFSVILFVAAFLTTYGVVLGLREEDLGPQLYAVWTVFFALSIAYWAGEDARAHRETWGMDWPFYVFILWPFILPFYLVRTRGWDGVSQFIGLLAIFEGPYLGNLIAWMYWV